MDEFKPRINGAMLSKYPERPVILAGEVVEEQGTTIILRAADGIKVSVEFEEAPLDLTQFVEVTGRVHANGTLEGWITTNIGDNFDLSTYNNAIQLLERFPEPFQS